LIYAQVLVDGLTVGLMFALVAMGAALRGTGNFKPGMFVQTGTVIINIVLAPVLIFGWGPFDPQGISGAAVATFVAIAIGVAWISFYFLDKNAYLRFHFTDWKPKFRVWGRMLAIGCFSVGTDQVAIADAARRGMPVFNAPYASTRSVAELTMGCVVALARRLGDKNTALHQRRWDKSLAGAHEVRGHAIGLIGYGHIGQQVGLLAEAFGMRVLYYDIAKKLTLGLARPVAELDELLLPGVPELREAVHEQDQLAAAIHCVMQADAVHLGIIVLEHAVPPPLYSSCPAIARRRRA